MDRIDFISILRSGGSTWEAITDEYNNEYTEGKTKNAIRKMYARHIAGEPEPRKISYKTKRLGAFTVHEDSMASLFCQTDLGRNDVLRIIVQPDTHVHNRDLLAVEAFCDFLKYYKPHGIVNLGDFLEMDAVSHWGPKDSSPRRLKTEITNGIAVLNQIHQAAGKQCTIRRFITGNHCDWLSQYLNTRVPELDGLGDLTVEKLLHLDTLGYKVIPLNEILRIGHAHFIHGYYTGTHHAKKHLDVFGVSIYYGHLHDVQAYSSVSVLGTHEAMSLGCLCKLDAPFLKGKPNNWSHAFGIFEFRIDGTYTRYVPIMNNQKFTFNGKTFGRSDR